MSVEAARQEQDRADPLSGRADVPYSDPAWFLHGLDLGNALAGFVRTSRSALADAVFLDPKWRPEGLAAPRIVPFASVRGFSTDAPPPAMIWHSAFCCSTLLAQCLDQPGQVLALKEPMALTHLAEAVRRRAPVADARFVEAVLALLARRFSPGERVAIKPSNSANLLAPFAVAMGSPTLLIYSSCRDFVLAIASGGPSVAGGELRRRFVRNLMAERLAGGALDTRWRPLNLVGLSDLQLAAIVWHLQMADFRALAAAPGGAVRSLDCERFLADPAGVLAAIDGLFGLNLGVPRIDAIVRGPKLARHAKFPEDAFTAADRRAQLDAAEDILGEALGATVAWSYAVCPETPRGDPVGAPLLPPQA
jgi:hypothetical protein